MTLESAGNKITAFFSDSQRANQMCWPASGDATLTKATVYEQDVFQSVIGTMFNAPH